VVSDVVVDPGFVVVDSLVVVLVDPGFVVVAIVVVVVDVVDVVAGHPSGGGRQTRRSLSRSRFGRPSETATGFTRTPARFPPSAGTSTSTNAPHAELANDGNRRPTWSRPRSDARSRGAGGKGGVQLGTAGSSWLRQTATWNRQLPSHAPSKSQSASPSVHSAARVVSARPSTRNSR